MALTPLLKILLISGASVGTVVVVKRAQEAKAAAAGTAGGIPAGWSSLGGGGGGYSAGAALNTAQNTLGVTDLNKDGVIDDKDLALFVQGALGRTPDVSGSMIDTNGDGIPDMTYANALLKGLIKFGDYTAGKAALPAAPTTPTVTTSPAGSTETPFAKYARLRAGLLGNKNSFVDYAASRSALLTGSSTPPSATNPTSTTPPAAPSGMTAQQLFARYTLARGQLLRGDPEMNFATVNRYRAELLAAGGSA